MTTTDATATPEQTATVTKITAPRKSRATRAADKATAPKAAAAKRTSAPKPAAAKPKVVKPSGPSATALKRELGTALIKVMADHVSTRKLPAGMTREDALKIVGQWASYIPGDMDPRLTAIKAGGRRKVS